MSSLDIDARPVLKHNRRVPVGCDVDDTSVVAEDVVSGGVEITSRLQPSERVARLRMRPMTLFDTGHSTGEVSLQGLSDGAIP